MVYNPRVSIILDEMEIALQNNSEVIFLGCNGELIKGCVYNPFKTKIACNSCKYFKKNDLSILSKKVKQYTISDFLPKNSKNYNWEYTTNSIKEIMYKKSDIGAACLSAYIDLTRNQKPKITPEFKIMFDKLLDTAAKLTDAIENALIELRPDKIYLFNARIHLRKPVFRAAQKKNIDCVVLEHTFFPGNKKIRKTKFINSSPHNIEYLTLQINNLWETADKKTRKNIGSDYYKIKLSGQNIDDVSYTQRQHSNLLPNNWDDSKHNVVIFNSSEDEFASLGKEWEYKFGKDIFSTIDELLSRFIDDKNYHFFLRIHPNLRKVKYYYHTILYKLTKYENLTIIFPESKISSYSLLRKSDKVISFGSTVGIEAVFWQKPSILLKSSFYIRLGGNYIPNNFEDLITLVKNKNLQIKEILPALKYGYFRSLQGESLKNFNPNSTKQIQIKIGKKLLFDYKIDYREELYKIRFPKISNFIRYKLYSIPKNIRKRIKNDIPALENKQAY